LANNWERTVEKSKIKRKLGGTHTKYTHLFSESLLLLFFGIDALPLYTSNTLFLLLGRVEGRA
jgi:hypothetical protein